MGTFKLFASSAIVLVYLMTFTVWQIQFVTRENMFDWLESLRKEDIYPLLDAAGIWSVEDIASRRIETLPDYIVKDEKTFQTYQYLETQACYHIMLPMWLKDNGLDSYAKIHNEVDLVTLANKYPGEIYYKIQELDHMLPSERHSLRKYVHEFKSAMTDFVYNKEKSAKVMAYKEKYAKRIVSWSWRYGPHHIQSLMKINKVQWIYTISFIAVSSLVLWLSIPTGLPLHGAFVLPLLSTYWIILELGKLNIFMMLLLRSFKEPARMVIFSGVLHIWLMAANDVIHSHYVLLFSALPTVLFMVCISSLRCQPSAVVEESSGLYDLTISGIGYLEKEVRYLAKAKKVSWLYSKLAAVTSLDKMEWEKVQRIKVEEVDVPWKTIQDFLQPAIKSDSLKVIWLADNYAITDDDAASIAKTIVENKNLDTLRITFNRRPSILDLLYRLLLWHQNPVRFTNDGALTILNSLADMEKCHLKTLDFCGIHLKHSFVKKIKEMPKLKSINILVNKRWVTDRKTKEEVISYILNKICLLLTLIYAGMNIYKIIHPSAINISFDTWIIETFEKYVYPHLHDIIEPYLQNLSLPGLALQSNH